MLAHTLKLTTAFDTQMILAIFYAVGIASVAAYLFLVWHTKATLQELCLDGSLAVWLIAGYLSRTQGPLYLLLSVAGLAGFVYMAIQTWKLGHEWLIALACGLLVILGALFYFLRAHRQAHDQILPCNGVTRARWKVSGTRSAADNMKR